MAKHEWANNVLRMDKYKRPNTRLLYFISFVSLTLSILALAKSFGWI